MIKDLSSFTNVSSTSTSIVLTKYIRLTNKIFTSRRIIYINRTQKREIGTLAPLACKNLKFLVFWSRQYYKQKEGHYCTDMIDQQDIEILKYYTSKMQHAKISVHFLRSLVTIHRILSLLIKVKS